MKIFFVGSLIDFKSMDKIVSTSKVKPSTAPVNFQYLLIKGLIFQKVDITVRSIPPIKSYPGGSLAFWGSRKEIIDFGLEIKWLPVINFQFLKQISIGVSTFFSLLSWLLKNNKISSKIIMESSIYPPSSIPILLLCKLFKCKTCVVVTDLPEIAYENFNSKNRLSKYSKIFTLLIINIQKRFDCYILFTKYLADKIKITNKPQIVIDGFSDPNLFNELVNIKKSRTKTLMYAGALTYAYSIDNLLKAFILLKGDYALWLFGSGECEGIIKDYIKKDKRIVFWGKRERAFVLEAQQKATLLFNLKKKTDANCIYCFPSKLFEYMASGTPVLCNRMAGIPDDYFEHFFVIDDETPLGIKATIENVINLDEKEMLKKGERAKKFVVYEKSYIYQSKKIGKFLMEQY